MSKTNVTLSLDADIWKQFQLYCMENHLVPSHVISKYISAKIPTKATLRQSHKLRAEAEARRLQQLINDKDRFDPLEN